MADSIPLVRQSVRHRIGMVSVMPPECCPPSLRNRVRRGLAHAAKLANDVAKPTPTGIFHWESMSADARAGRLGQIEVREVWGVGPRLARRLAELGIHSAGELARVDFGGIFPRRWHARPPSCAASLVFHWFKPRLCVSIPV
jgi:hypothetical protein